MLHNSQLKKKKKQFQVLWIDPQLEHEQSHYLQE